MFRKKHLILNNTKLMMNLFSFLELTDLVKMRNINSTSKLISEYYIKMNINKDKIKYNLSNFNKNESDKNKNENTKFIYDSNNISLLRMKFLQLWNIYSNKNYMEKINYYDKNLYYIIKLLLYLFSNMKDNLDFKISISNEDLNNCDVNNDEIPYFIQEFFRNEYIWRYIAKISGYNLSNAELVSDSHGVLEYYLWPEKINEPKQCIIDQNIIDNLLNKLLRIKNLDHNIYKQISFLLKKSTCAELTFYNNDGIIVNKSNIHIYDSNKSINNTNNKSFLLDINNMNTNDVEENYNITNNSDFSKNATAVINDELFSSLIHWLVNFLKIQRQLPCLKHIPKSNNKVGNLHHNHHYIINKKSISPCKLNRSTNKDTNINSINSSSYNSELPEAVGKLCSVIKSQEDLLTELKFILNAMK